MNTTLNGVLPLTQPYNGSPWEYYGDEQVSEMPIDVVDWILVELRTGTAAATVVATRAAFLLPTAWRITWLLYPPASLPTR